jgi:hypothetical protein
MCLCFDTSTDDIGQTHYSEVEQLANKDYWSQGIAISSHLKNIRFHTIRESTVGNIPVGIKRFAPEVDSAAERRKGKSIVVVLGMHRSGTSVITRGLTVIGVELGDRLMPPAKGNERGFFEDIDLHVINRELCNSLRRPLHWHTPGFARLSELLDKKNAPFRRRAMEVLQHRLETSEYFGIKDPAFCRTLPFWQSIFEELQLNISYVIAARNPLSVVQSLGKRDNLPPGKCYRLWLDHVLLSILGTQGACRILVDYDLLLANPSKQISRIAFRLGLVERLDPMRLEDFSQNFLDKRLRHTNFEVEDIYRDQNVPALVRTVSTLLSDLAADNLNLDSEYVTEVFADLSKQAHREAELLHKLFVAFRHWNPLKQGNIQDQSAYIEQDGVRLR